MNTRQLFPAGDFPEIPTSRLAAIVNEREPLLFWVHTGHAELSVAGRVHSVSAGSAVWVPAGVAYGIRVDPEAVAFPIPLPAVDLPPAPSRIVELEIPDAWQDWLVHRFAYNLGFLRGSTTGGSGLLELVAGTRSGHGSPSFSAPGLPRSTEALEVARTLLRTPADDTELSRFAVQLRIGVRTLQRRFAEETGLSFVRWRGAVRIAAATAYLDEGREIGWTGRQVGFLTPAGFTRAFREHTGRTPSDYARTSESTVPARARENLATGIALLADDTHPPPPPPIPPSQTWARVSDFHVVVWVYRGTARVAFGDGTWNLHRGDAMWLPAGVRNSVEIAAGSLLLPLGSQPGITPVPGPARILHFPRAVEAYLLHTVVANYTHLRPSIHDVGRITHLVRSAAVPAAALGAEPVEAILAAVRVNPADSRTTADWGSELGIRPDLLRARFVSVTGQTFPRWRAQLRMTLARTYLEEGISAGEAARRLGYAHASGFTKVFRAAHGMSPREYQRSGWRGTAERLLDP
ncbi:AraC-like DNA-binding protein/quercetin dioxygenase-like cupin family protein [Rhodococcus sp. 27YEA15]|uniref:helix-turn-helix transcriptional regulator n=1 Tax=Rhodococcus sp. 27YEA15 TaxID=3156259 RepID=UPI003C7E4ED4